MTSLWFSLQDFFSTSSNWSGPSGIPARVGEHAVYTILAWLLAAGIAVPIGLWTGHSGRAGLLVGATANAARALPTYGVLVLLVVLLGIGLGPVLIPLVALAVPPILLNTYEGVRAVPPTTTDAARGMGMTGREVLWQVELPMALPLMLVGLRTAAVQVVATATIAAAVSFGGIGRYIIDGLARRDYTLVVGGAVLAMAASILVLGLFVVARRVLVSPGLR